MAKVVSLASSLISTSLDIFLSFKFNVQCRLYNFLNLLSFEPMTLAQNDSFFFHQGTGSLSQRTPPPMKRLFSDSGINPSEPSSTSMSMASSNTNKKPTSSTTSGLSKLLDFSDLPADFGLADLPMTPPPPPACPPPPPSRQVSHSVTSR